MNTNLKALLIAVGIAVVASPVMAAQVHTAPSATSISKAHGSAAREHTAPAVNGNPFGIDDAVHVAFPQRDGGV